MKAWLQRLTRFGTSLEISWGEDDNLWSVAWITGGKRFNASSLELEDALGQVWLDAAIYKGRSGGA